MRPATYQIGGTPKVQKLDTDAFGRPLPRGATRNPKTGAITNDKGGVWFAGYAR